MIAHYTRRWLVPWTNTFQPLFHSQPEEQKAINVKVYIKHPFLCRDYLRVLEGFCSRVVDGMRLTLYLGYVSFEGTLQSELQCNQG